MVSQFSVVYSQANNLINYSTLFVLFITALDMFNSTCVCPSGSLTRFDSSFLAICDVNGVYFPSTREAGLADARAVRGN